MNVGREDHPPIARVQRHPTVRPKAGRGPSLVSLLRYTLLTCTPPQSAIVG